VSKTGIPGYIVRLAESSAEISLGGQVGIHSNLKILLMSQEVQGLSEVYAKVVSVDESDSTSSRISVRLAFTWIPKDVKTFFDNKRSVKGISDRGEGSHLNY
jgi:hypothetical protein